MVRVDKPVSTLLTGFFVWLDPSCQHEVDASVRDGVSSNERARIKDLECEVKELRKAKEILKLASVFFLGGAGPPTQVLRDFVDQNRKLMGASRFVRCCKSHLLATGAKLPSNANPNSFAHGPNAMKHLCLRPKPSTKPICRSTALSRSVFVNKIVLFSKSVALNFQIYPSIQYT
jgi:hypothetical protein